MPHADARSTEEVKMVPLDVVWEFIEAAERANVFLGETDEYRFLMMAIREAPVLREEYTQVNAGHLEENRWTHKRWVGEYREIT